MKGRIWRLNDFKSEKGSIFISIILVFLIVSLLGMGLIFAAASNLNLTSSERSKQAAYYIAESGINRTLYEIGRKAEELSQENLDHDEFFQQLGEFIGGMEGNFSQFDRNFGHQPRAEISIELEGPIAVDSQANSSKMQADYSIKSKGIIGKSSRMVSAVIAVGISMDGNNIIIEETLLYAKNFKLKGTSANAASGTIIMDGLTTHDLNGGASLNVSNMYFNGPVKFNGGSASFGHKDYPGKILVNGDLELWNGTREVYGEIRVKGNFRLKDAKIHGDVYVDGDLELGWTPVIHGNIYYTGTLQAPNNFDTSLLSKCRKVDSADGFEIPLVSYDLKEDQWYRDNGYTIEGHETGEIPENGKMLVDSYRNRAWQDIKGELVIISKGDIILRGGGGMTGALIAPNGKVEYGGDGEFNGVIISKEEINLSAGGSNFYLQSLADLFADKIPVKITHHNTNNESTENNDSGKIQSLEVKIKSPIREE